MKTEDILLPDRSTPMSHRYPRFIRWILNRYVLATLATVLIGFTCWLFGHIPLIASYDRQYSKLNLGDQRTRIVALLGDPHETRTWTSKVGLLTEYVYCVYPFPNGPNPVNRTRWSLVFDSSDRLVSKIRSDDGC